MQLSLQSSVTGFNRTRPVILLAADTLQRRMNEVDPARAFHDLEDFAIYMNMIRIEQAGSGVPLKSPEKPGRVGHRKANRLLTIDIQFNEMNMVFDRVTRDAPGGRTFPASRDFLDTFLERLDTATAPLIAWCDRKDAWADRDHFFGHWDAARAALADGTLLRPFEFTLAPLVRNALDATWALVEATPLEAERFEWLAQAYFLIRDAGWQDADYEADPDAELTPFGYPTIVANFTDNIASAPPPDATYGYSAV
jgi:hypothetical protein